MLCNLVEWIGKIVALSFKSLNCGYIAWICVQMINVKLILTYYPQVRDEYRQDYDSGRGGYGKILQQKIQK